MGTNHTINDMMETTIRRIRDLVDVNTIIGDPVVSGQVTLIPVSKLSVGFGTGGSDFPMKGKKEEDPSAFGGGGAAGVKITPVAFLAVHGDQVKLLPMAAPADSTADRIVELIPELLEKVSGIFGKKDGKSKDNDN